VEGQEVFAGKTKNGPTEEAALGARHGAQKKAAAFEQPPTEMQACQVTCRRALTVLLPHIALDVLEFLWRIASSKRSLPWCRLSPELHSL
jgi:hypothetical protein